MTFFHRTFKRKAFVDECVALAIEEQVRFEAEHPIPYAPDQRTAAICQRAEAVVRRKGGRIVPHERIRLVVVAALTPEAT